MFYTLSWLAIAALFAFWSLAAWALHAVADWTLTRAGALSGSAAGLGDIALPEWLAPWVPVEWVQSFAQLMTGFVPLLESLLQATPTLAGGMTVVAWVLWGIGSALLLMLGAGLHFAIRLWLRRSARGSSAQTVVALATR